MKRTQLSMGLAISALVLTSCSGDDGATVSTATTTASVGATADVSHSETRSVTEYCRTFYELGQQFRAAYQNVDFEGDPVGGLIAVLGAPQEAALFFGRLESVAPDEIEPDIIVLKDAMQHVSDNMAANGRDPVLGMLDALSVGASTRGAQQRVDEFTLRNCGEPPVSSGGAGGSASQTSVATSDPEPGDLVLSLQIDGYAIAKIAGATIATLASQDGMLGVRTFDLRGAPLSSNLIADAFDDQCKLSMVRRSDGVDVVFTIRTTQTPAQGIEPAHQTQTLVAADSGDLTRSLWEAELGQDDDVSYCSPGATNGNDLVTNISFTSNGRWGLLTMTSATGPKILDLMTGTLRAIDGAQYPDELSVAGDYILQDASGDFDDGEIRLIDPETATVLATNADLAVLRSQQFITVDETHVLASSSKNGNTGTGVTQLLSLPSLTPVWAKEFADYPYSFTASAFFDQMSGTLMLWDSGSPLVAVSVDSGEIRWQVDANFCTSLEGVVAVGVNDQMAYLDAASGEQIRFDPNQTACPSMLSASYSYVVRDGSDLSIYRFI